ncbi:ferredoxin [Jatrophihabitans sp.]|uniref:ferredoxin n=1 Tax=Jatrophihabitans sp. TaxID=1932789 RepID=UPI0030C71883|nr:ferredoxin [Jatrophihabitans sp.]
MSDEQALTYVIDSELCAGHGRCYALAPESFEADDSGYSTVTGAAKPAAEREGMHFIAGQCPEEAISIHAVGVTS